MQGCHGQGKTDFFSRSGNSISSQGNTKFYLKVSEKSGYFLGEPLGLGKGFLVDKGGKVVSKVIYRRPVSSVGRVPDYRAGGR